MSVIHEQIKALSRAEKLELVQELWDDLAAEGLPSELTAAQAEELDRRLAQHRADPTEGCSLEDIAAALHVRL